MRLAPGISLGPYVIAGPLGAGGMGEVYRARDPRLGRDVAVKVLAAGRVADADELRRFEREARAAAPLSHPNILTVFDLGTHEGLPYLVCELLEGRTLRERLASGPVPPEAKLRPAVVDGAETATLDGSMAGGPIGTPAYWPPSRCGAVHPITARTCSPSGPSSSRS